VHVVVVAAATVDFAAVALNVAAVVVGSPSAPLWLEQLVAAVLKIEEQPHVVAFALAKLVSVAVVSMQVSLQRTDRVSSHSLPLLLRRSFEVESSQLAAHLQSRRLRRP